MIARPAIATRVAAFFDIDGTLLPAPSLERRFFANLRRTRAIPRTNYLHWLIRSAQLVPRGLATIAYANKMYLRDVPTKSLDRADGADPSAPSFPAFFPASLAQVGWHATLGHAIVLVTGTLTPLAHRAAIALTLRLAARGITASIAVCATRLEEINGRYSGEIAGEPIFGPAKARAIRRIAAEEGLDLPRCYAYADSSSDRWMLAAVGRPAAVNPASDLKRVARLHDWPILNWQAAPIQCRGALCVYPDEGRVEPCHPSQPNHKRNLVQQQDGRSHAPEFEQPTLNPASSAAPKPEPQS